MKRIIVTANYPDSGITTILVNLACGLFKQGMRILIADESENGKLAEWLGVYGDDQESKYSAGVQWEGIIASSRLGIDYIRINSQLIDNSYSLAWWQESAYDFTFTNSQNLLANQALACNVEAVLVCTDLSHGDEVEELQRLEHHLLTVTGKSNLIKLIIPNKINTKEWEHNSGYLFAIAEHYGFEAIADPIPHCERIHDLSMQGYTVWDLKQKNLQEAFNRLVEAVVKI
jgi:cellulose biosynthesis protein BcsQ